MSLAEWYRSPRAVPVQVHMSRLHESYKRIDLYRFFAISKSSTKDAQ
jgi:hypothetical protein